MNIPNQDDATYLEWRRHGLGASDAATVLNMNPWKSATKLWAQKIGLIPEDPENEKMREGKRLESEAIDLYEIQSGIKMLRKTRPFLHKKYPFLFASMDGISFDYEHAVEVKCSYNCWSDACSGIISKYYICQMQHQMMCLDLDKMDYCAYWDGACKIWPVLRDDEFIEKMIEAELSFYECMKNKTPPLDPTGEQISYRTDEEFISWENLYHHYDNDIKLMELRKEEARQELIKLSDGKNCIGSKIKMTKYIKRGTLSYSDIPEIKEMDLEKYRKQPTEQWKITIKEEINNGNA